MATDPTAPPRFPCPLCGEGLDVRETKKGKPYVICDPCGVQLFVRGKQGIQRFKELVGKGVAGNVWARMEGLKERYQKKCPKCGREFWADEGLIETSWLDGKLVGYRCPEAGCGGVAKTEAGE